MLFHKSSCSLQHIHQHVPLNLGIITCKIKKFFNIAIIRFLRSFKQIETINIPKSQIRFKNLIMNNL